MKFEFYAGGDLWNMGTTADQSTSIVNQFFISPMREKIISDVRSAIGKTHHVIDRTSDVCYLVWMLRSSSRLFNQLRIKLRFRFSAELLGVEMVVLAAFVQQFGMRTHLGDGAVLDKDDPAGALDG